MPWTRVVLAVMLLAVAVAVPTTSASATPVAVKKINHVRHAHGLPSLRYSSSLHRSSTRFARHLMRADYFGHASRIRASSRFSLLGECLAQFSGWRLRPGRTVRAWMRSPGHRAILLSRSFTSVGVGSSRGRFGRSPSTIWVAQFGRR